MRAEDCACRIRPDVGHGDPGICWDENRGAAMHFPHHIAQIHPCPPVLQEENFIRSRVSMAFYLRPPGGKSSVPRTKFDEPALRGSKINGPGCPSQPSAPSIGLQTRLSPSFFSRMSGVTVLALVEKSFVAVGSTSEQRLRSIGLTPSFRCARVESYSRVRTVGTAATALQ